MRDSNSFELLFSEKSEGAINWATPSTGNESSLQISHCMKKGAVPWINRSHWRWSATLYNSKSLSNEKNRICNLQQYQLTKLNLRRTTRKVPQGTGRRIIGQNAGHEIHLEVEYVLDRFDSCANIVTPKNERQCLGSNPRLWALAQLVMR